MQVYSKHQSGQGAKASITNSSGTSALCLAVKNKHLGAVKALVEGGADLSYQVTVTLVII